MAPGSQPAIASSAGFVQAVYTTVHIVRAQQKPKFLFSFTSAALINPKKGIVLTLFPKRR
ncbi:MAG: hypothetical protein K9J22_05140 [Burkholderiaceae bacterium]|nr:hypothetical protein [Burkholderiaceae bacterium]